MSNNIIGPAHVYVIVNQLLLVIKEGNLVIVISVCEIW